MKNIHKIRTSKSLDRSVLTMTTMLLETRGHMAKKRKVMAWIISIKEKSKAPFQYFSINNFLFSSFDIAFVSFPWLSSQSYPLNWTKLMTDCINSNTKNGCLYTHQSLRQRSWDFCHRIYLNLVKDKTYYCTKRGTKHSHNRIYGESEEKNESIDYLQLNNATEHIPKGMPTRHINPVIPEWYAIKASITNNKV